MFLMRGYRRAHPTGGNRADRRFTFIPESLGVIIFRLSIPSLSLLAALAARRDTG